ncbi:19392_t:CDS:1, partial [Entrophospora sp. SA101]
MSFILNKWKKSGYSVVLTGLSRIGSSKTTTYNGYIMANIGIADTPRPDSKKTIEKLKSLGIEVWMITGDNPITAKAIGKQLGIDNIFSEVTPEMKADKIKWLQRK